MKEIQYYQEAIKKALKVRDANKKKLTQAKNEFETVKMAYDR